MEMWVTILVIVIAVASRPIEVRLWRAGRLSDRALALLLVGRFPVLIGLSAALSGGPPPVILLLVAMSLLPGLFYYRFILDFIRGEPRP